MFGSTAIEVAIGLIFVYLALGLVCSSLNEIIAGFTRLRGRTLKEGIHRMLSDVALRTAFYDHPLIKTLSQKPRKKTRHPSYIPSGTFAVTLLDVVSRLEKKHTHAGAAEDPDPDPAAGSAVLDFAGLRKKIDGLPAGDIRTALLTLFDNANNDLQQAKQNVEAWFDGTMDRVSGWYKRKTQMILLVLAFFVSGVMNADTISLAGAFLQNPALRQQVAAAAERFIEQQDSDAAETGSGDEGTPVDEFRRQLTAFDTLNLPLGWSQDTLPSGAGWILKIIGLAFTAFAASLGAPFWFDLLGKVAKMRVTGNVPKKTTATE